MSSRASGRGTSAGCRYCEQAPIANPSHCTKPFGSIGKPNNPLLCPPRLFPVPLSKCQSPQKHRNQFPNPNSALIFLFPFSAAPFFLPPLCLSSAVPFFPALSLPYLGCSPPPFFLSAFFLSPPLFLFSPRRRPFPLLFSSHSPSFSIFNFPFSIFHWRSPPPCHPERSRGTSARGSLRHRIKDAASKGFSPPRGVAAA